MRARVETPNLGVCTGRRGAISIQTVRGTDVAMQRLCKTTYFQSIYINNLKKNVCDILLNLHFIKSMHNNILIILNHTQNRLSNLDMLRKNY